MLRILYQEDRLDNIEANLVAEAANRLGVGEFQFFRLAHNAWFGGEVEPLTLEPVFLSYMTDDQVPHYVRQFARIVIHRDDAGELDPEADEFHRFDAGRPASPNLRRGAYTVAMVVVFTAAFMALTLYAYRPSVVGDLICNYPPCPYLP